MKTGWMVLVGFLAFGILGAGEGAQQQIAWIKKEYARIEKAIAQKMLPWRKHSRYDGAAVENAELYLDENESVRKLHCEGGSEDSAAEASYYYRRDGTLFFSYLRSANVHDCLIEIRNYFDARGRVIRTLRNDAKACASLYIYPSAIRDPQKGYADFCDEKSERDANEDRRVDGGRK